MFSTGRIHAAGLSLASLLSAGLAQANPPSAVPLDTLVKVKTDWAPQGNEGTEVDVSAAGNEVAAFQVAILGGTGGVPGVSASLQDLHDGAGHGLPAGSITLFREDVLNVTQPSDGGGGTGNYPDALVPAQDEVAGEARSAFPFDVAAGQTRAIWVDVRVPAHAGPDVFRGTLALSGGIQAQIPVVLTVYPFDLPATSSLRSAFLAFTPSICALELGSADACASPAGQALLSRYVQLALDHRVSLTNVEPVAASASDLSGYDTALAPFLEGSAPTRLAGAKLTSLQYPLGANAAQYQAFLSDAQAHGWADRTFVYAADEPGFGASTWDQARQVVSAVQSAAPGLPTLVTTTVQAAQQNGVAPNILVPAVNEMDDVSGTYAGDQRPAYDSFVQSGGQLWMYQSCMSHGCAFGGDPTQSGWPSYMIDASPVRNRAMQWADFREQVSGELYYETVNAYQGDPWTDQYRFGGNGDGTLFYPGGPSRIGGSTEVPLASLRLKQIRAGMEDYEYLTLVSALGDPGFAMTQAQTVVPSVHAVNPDPNALRAARAALAQRILALVAPLSTGGAPSSGTATGGAAAPGPSQGGSAGPTGATARGSGGSSTALPPGEPALDGAPSLDAVVSNPPKPGQSAGCGTAPGTSGVAAAFFGLLALARSRRRASRS